MTNVDTIARAERLAKTNGKVDSLDLKQAFVMSAKFIYAVVIVFSLQV